MERTSWRVRAHRSVFPCKLEILSIFPEGVSPWALLRRTGRRKCPNFSKFSLLFFFGFGLYLVQEKRGKKNFRIGHFRFQTFRLSVKICGKHNSKTITFFDLRPGEEKFCSYRNRVPRYKCRPPPMPPLPPSPQKRVFSPQFSTSISSEVSNFFEIVTGGKMFPWYLKINF